MFQVHRGMSKKEGMKRAVDLMEQVRIPAAKERVGTTRTSSPAACASAS